jgi:hypothetical protein
MLVALAAIMPPVFMIIAMVIAIVVSLAVSVARFSDHAGRRQ